MPTASTDTPATIKLVCDEIMQKFIDKQNFAAAVAIREIRRSVDPDGRKVLTPRQAKTVRTFCHIVAKNALK